MTASYIEEPVETVDVGRGRRVASFLRSDPNVDGGTLRAFSEEWVKFDRFDPNDVEEAGREYFDVLDSQWLNEKAVVLDVGCGSGRWTRHVSRTAGRVEAIDPSPSIFHAARVHSDLSNVRWTRASVDTIPFPDDSFDLVVCLGVLHHLPDPEGGLRAVVRKIRPGGGLLLYVYYALENRGRVYRTLFRIATVARRGICRLPGPVKRGVCDGIAVVVCMPLVATARLLKRLRPKSDAYRKVPLAYYHNKGFRIIRNDTLDRFGTPVEKRFTRGEIEAMMRRAGLDDVVFSEAPPYWHALATKPKADATPASAAGAT